MPLNDRPQIDTNKLNEEIVNFSEYCKANKLVVDEQTRSLTRKFLNYSDRHLQMMAVEGSTNVNSRAASLVYAFRQNISIQPTSLLAEI